MDGIEETSQRARRANELYWESRRSVNQIAEELGLSKGGLYDLISPLASPFRCPACGEPLRYAHRTAHERGVLSCSECGAQIDDDDPSLEQREAEPEVTAPQPPAAYVPRPSSPPPRRILAGTAILGVGVGLLLARLLRRR